MWCNQSLVVCTKHSSLWAARRSLQTSPECNPLSVGCLGLEMCKNCALVSSSSFLLAGGGLVLKIVHVTDAPVTAAWRNGILLLCVGRITVPEHEQEQSCWSWWTLVSGAPEPASGAHQLVYVLFLPSLQLFENCCANLNSRQLEGLACSMPLDRIGFFPLFQFWELV